MFKALEKSVAAQEELLKSVGANGKAADKVVEGLAAGQKRDKALVEGIMKGIELGQQQDVENDRSISVQESTLKMLDAKQGTTDKLLGTMQKSQKGAKKMLDVMASQDQTTKETLEALSG